MERIYCILDVTDRIYNQQIYSDELIVSCDLSHVDCCHIVFYLLCQQSAVSCFF